jgi:hypothetical protein
MLQNKNGLFDSKNSLFGGGMCPVHILHVPCAYLETWLVQKKTGLKRW